MRKLFLLPIILLTFYVQSQSIENGIYYTIKKDIGFTSEIFEFKDQNRFNYSLFDCTGSSLGTGTYKIMQDSLHLKFDKKTSLKIDEIKFKTTTSDSLSINIIVSEKHSDYPLPGVTCLFLDSKIGWQSDFDGLIIGKIQKHDIPKTLRFQYIGYSIYDIEINPEISEITGIVKMDDIYFYGSSDEIKVKFKEANNRRFKLEFSDKVNITYRRVNRNKASKIIKNRTGEDYDYFFPNY